jgi:Tol biopolymer transport system component
MAAINISIPPAQAFEHSRKAYAEGRDQRPSRTRCALVLAALLGLMLLVPARGEAAANGRIMYSTGIPNDAPPSGSLVTVNPLNGSDWRSLGIDTWTQGASATWSRNGQQIAYAGLVNQDAYAPPGQDIYTANADGGNVQRIISGADNEESPDWSPDGQRLAYTVVPSEDGNSFYAYAPPHSEIWVAGTDGSNPIRLSTAGASDYNPTWSPDGSKIAFSSRRTGTREIYVMAPNGSEVRRLTSNTVEDDFPSWSPDGRRLVWSHDVWPHGGGSAPASDVWVMSANGARAKRLTRTSDEDWNPVWSPDGRSIAFERRTTDPLDNGYSYSHIFLMSTSGTKQRQLVQDGLAPSWQAIAKR